MSNRNSHGRVVITGLGTFGAGGINVADLWQNARSKCDISQMRRLSSGSAISVYAAPDPVLTAETTRSLRHADRTACLAMAAASEAWTDAKLPLGDTDPLRIGVVVGSSRGPAALNAACGAGKPRRPTDSVYTAFSSIAGIVASSLKVEGCSIMVSATCTSGAVAAHSGFQMLRSGALDIVLVGGVDAPLVDGLLEQMAVTGVLARGVGPGLLRPFAPDRDGTLLGEGAAFLVLESEASAFHRAVSSYGALEGVAIGHEVDSRTRLDESGKGLQRVLHASLHQAARHLEDVDLIHLHGTGTRRNDAIESRCLYEVYGEATRQPLSWASKGVTGHTLGAAPLFQAILSLQAMRHSYLPGTANCSELDETCAIRLNIGSGTAVPISTSVCLTSGFWGNVSSLVFGSS